MSKASKILKRVHRKSIGNALTDGVHQPLKAFARAMKALNNSSKVCEAAKEWDKYKRGA